METRQQHVVRAALRGAKLGALLALLITTVASVIAFREQFDFWGFSIAQILFFDKFPTRVLVHGTLDGFPFTAFCGAVIGAVLIAIAGLCDRIPDQPPQEDAGRCNS